MLLGSQPRVKGVVSLLFQLGVTIEKEEKKKAVIDKVRLVRLLESVRFQ